VLIQPDLLVRDVLVDLFQSVHEDPDRLTEVFETRPAAEREEIREFFANLVVPVDLGFRREQPSVPGSFVTLGASQETGTPPIGEFVAEEDQDPTKLDAEIREYTGSLFRSVVRIGLMAENANLAIWMGNVVLWGLLQARTLLTQQGLLEPQLAAQDLVLDGQQEPAYVFRRDITLQAMHLATVRTVFPKLRGVVVGAQFYDDTRVYRAVLRR
jgi:hypothetical protein